MTQALPPPFDALDLPPPWPEPLLEAIRAHNNEAFSSIVVLDDDPLGGQCVHDVPVLTDWHTHDLASELEQSPAFMLLTNTRSLPRQEAVQRAEEIGFALQQAALDAGVLPKLVWRSDSTLRGHFYREMSALAREFSLDGMPEPVYVFLPYFGDGGRYTLDATQYALQGSELVQVSETEFARDPAFAYTHSHLPAWLEAHSEGRIRADDVLAITLDDIRRGGPERVAGLLRSADPNGAVVVDAIADADVEVFVAGLQRVEDEGGYFLCSGAASFVRARLGQELRPTLTASELDLEAGAGGLTIVGSYAERTTSQLERIIADGNARVFELVLARKAPDGLADLAAVVAGHLAAGEDVVLDTSRTHTPDVAPEIADALATFIRVLPARPRYLLVKGGTTAGHIATECLGVQRAVVLGRLLPGVPVWRLGDECRWPGLPFVIFPGNVGEPDSLAEAIRLLAGG